MRFKYKNMKTEETLNDVVNGLLRRTMGNGDALVVLRDVIESECEKWSGKLLETERELYLAEREIEKLKQDSEMLNWIQQIMTQKESYCEVFFAGLRSGNNDATEFQIESNPEKFEVLKAKNIREVILMAMSVAKKV